MSGYAHYVPTGLPHAGGVHEQPAKLMQAFTLLEQIAGDELREDLAESKRKKTEADERSRTRNQD
jgi:hypothetical protein